eukprot:6840339-Pyramimonas_sp.AAC.2
MRCPYSRGVRVRSHAWSVWCLMAFGQIRTRVWIMGQRRHGCWQGSHGLPLGGPLKAAVGPPGGRLGASWGLL